MPSRSTFVTPPTAIFTRCPPAQLLRNLPSLPRTSRPSLSLCHQSLTSQPPLQPSSADICSIHSISDVAHYVYPGTQKTRCGWKFNLDIVTLAPLDEETLLCEKCFSGILTDSEAESESA